MAVQIRINQPVVEAKIKTAWKESLAPLAEAIRDDCNQYCKEDTGMLIASSMIHSLPKEGKVIWQTKYARRQYWEIRAAHTDVNPKATWKWCEAAKRACSDTWQRQAQRLLEMNL